jgi:5'-nucleotidase
MLYSGTVAAAMEAAICGLPSFAISVTSYEATDFQPAAEFAAVLAGELLGRELPKGCFLNVNVPPVSRAEIAGVVFTRQGPLRYDNRMERRTDPSGEHYYWFTGERVNHGDGPGSDVHAVSRNLISVTPVRLDLTGEAALDQLSGWTINWPKG